MTSKIVVNNIQTDAGISSVTLLSHIAGHDSTQNISGINSVTANAFYGDGSNLTGVSGVTINSNAANRIITGSGSANTLEGNSNFTYTGSVVTHNNPSGLAKLDVKGSVGGGALGASISVRNTNSANNGSGEFQFQDPGSNIFAKIAGVNLTDGSNNGYVTFHTASATAGLVERLRIFSNGSVGVGDFSSASLTHAFQALRTSGSTYVSSKNTGGSARFYAEASNGNTAALELMQAGTGNFTLEVGSDNALMFKDDGTEKLRINSGSVWINGSAMPTSSSGARLQVGAHTFTGSNHVYHTSRLGIQNNGSLTCISNCSTYSDVTYPGYGFVMVQGASTSDYNTFGICPDSPQTGSDLNFHAGYRKSNIHSDSGVRQMWLNFSGQVYKRDNGANWNQTSDERLKKNIVDNNIGLAEIKQLRITSFEYRKADEIDMSLFPKANDPLQVIIEGEEGPHTGVIAQEIESVLPECVKTSDKGAKTVQADAITWALVNAVKELSAKNDALEERIKNLEGS